MGFDEIKMAKSLKHTTAFRKGSAFLKRLPRGLARFSADEAAYKSNPPVIVNSLPKSGTNLLLQIVAALPGLRDFGAVVAQTPSLTLKLRSQAEMDQRIARIVPGEIIHGHIYYSPETEAALARINAVNLFIWRDPRDVLMSEAHYIANMNRWHKMHKTFAALDDVEAQVRLAVVGTGDDSVYPGAEERVGAYMGWVNAPKCVSLRYEELVDPGLQLDQCQRILDAYAAASDAPMTLPTAQELVDAINPEKSHTFNRGGIARWKNEMSAENQALCQERLGPWLT